MQTILVSGFTELKKLQEEKKLWAKISKCKELYDRRPVVQLDENV